MMDSANTHDILKVFLNATDCIIPTPYHPVHMVNSLTVLAALAPSSPALVGTWPRLPRRGLKRPRGLWKARRRLDPAAASSYQLTQAPGGGATSSSSGRGSDTEHDEEEREMDESGDEDCDEMSQGSSSSKRQRRDSGSSGSVMELWAAGAAGVHHHMVVADSDRPASSGVSPPEDKNKNSNNYAAVVRPPLISNMVTTSIAESASSCKDAYELKDWEELQETLARASELYDHDDLLGSISLLRAVIHECHRFLRRFPDASHFFPRPVPQRQREGSRSPDPVLGLEDRLWPDSRSPNPADKRGRSIDRMSTNPIPDSDNQSPHRSHRHHESPTAFHAVLGIALFLFGNIIAQNTTLALSREPNTPSPYWLAALDVFDAGNNLPCHTSGNDSSDAAADHDWRVAIAWGRSLVSLAYEATTKSSPPPSPSPLTASPSSPRSHTQRYPPRSPLAAIAALRMPGTAHSRASAQELLTYAADQFARGIFHMPHSLPCAARPHELFTLAAEVLAVAERLDDAEARRRWATWADAVFLQMHMEADVDAWRARIAVARGRCWLAVGSARADEMEDALERGDARVLHSKAAEDSRAALVMSISFFDRAKGSASTESPETSLTDMQPLLAEALLSLANLTADEGAREALYARAQVEGGEAVRRELGPSPTSSRQILTADVQMDES